MSRSTRLVLSPVLAFAAGAGAGPAPTPPPRVGIPVALVSAAGRVSLGEPGRDWREVEGEARLRTGDRLRTGPGALAWIQFPWMALAAGPSSTLRIPGGVVLSVVLEEGRVQLVSQGGDIVTVRTSDAQLRGRGHVVVRRGDGVTWISVLEGAVRLDAGGRTVALEGGQGAVVRPAASPAATTLPEAPGRLRPGADPLYVLQGQPVELSWISPGEWHRLQLLELDGDRVLVDREVGQPPQTLEIPWLGTFRWRVLQRDARGLESTPSPFGYVCVVER